MDVWTSPPPKKGSGFYFCGRLPENLNGLESWIGVTNDFWSRGRPTREVGSGIAVFAVQMEIHVDAAQKKSKNFLKRGFETYCSSGSHCNIFGLLNAWK